MSAYLTPTVTATYPTFAYKEKEQSTPYVAPVAKTNIDAEKLQHILEEVNKTLSLPSETPSIAESEAPSLYPSAANGESLSESTQSASDTANNVSFFNSSFGKVQSQVKSTFPKGYAFLETVFNKKALTAKDAFAIFDGIRLSLQEKKYKDLPDFAGLCKKAPGLEKALEELENRFDVIKDDFKDTSIYQKIEREQVSAEKYQVWLDKRSKVENGLVSLVPTIKSIDTAINSLKSELLSEEQSFSVRMITGTLTGIGLVATFFGFPGIIISFASHAANLGFETKQFLLKQKIKEWEAFKKPLEELKNKNPLTEEEVINTFMASSNRAATQHSQSLQKLEEKFDNTQAQTSVQLEATKKELAEVKVQNEQIMSQLADLKQILNVVVMSKA